MTELNKQHLAGAVLTSGLVSVAIAGLCVFVVTKTLASQHEVSEVNRDGISCVLEQLNDHRVNSYNSDKQDARVHKLELDAPAPAPQPLPRELLRACDRFLENTTE